VRDLDLIDNQGQVIETAQRIPDAWRVKYLNRSMDRLPADVTKAFDRLWQVEREKDRLAAALEDTRKQLSWERWKSRALIVVVSGEAVVIGWLVTVVSHALR
jgi:hypothetical protein